MKEINYLSPEHQVFFGINEDNYCAKIKFKNVYDRKAFLSQYPLYIQTGRTKDLVVVECEDDIKKIIQQSKLKSGKKYYLGKRLIKTLWLENMPKFKQKHPNFYENVVLP